MSHRKMETTWSAWRGEGNVNYKHYTALSELIDNFIPDENYLDLNTYGIHGQMIIDYTNNRIIINDNFCGIPNQSLQPIWDSGKKISKFRRMSEHGKGMIIATNWLGEFEHIISKYTDGNDWYIVKPHFESGIPYDENDIAGMESPEVCDSIKYFDVSTMKWINKYNQGTQLSIKLVDSPIPKRKDAFKEMVNKLNFIYGKLLSELDLNIEIIGLDSNQVIHYEKLKPNHYLKSSTKHKFINKDKTLGEDEWDDIFEVQHMGRKVMVYGGFRPETKLVEQYYKESGDEKYNPEVYKHSPFTYGSEGAGWHYIKNGKIVEMGAFKPSSRDTSSGGLIEIVTGIKTLTTKDGIVRREPEKELENKIEKELNRRGFNARSQSGLPQIKETTMRDRLFEKIKTSEDVRTLLGWGSLDSIDDDKDIEYRCDSGAIDTYNLDGDNGIILELKNNDANFDAGFQALTYAMERFQKTGIKHRIILVAKKKDIPSDMEIKLNVWRAQGWDIKYFQWQKLMSM